MTQNNKSHSKPVHVVVDTGVKISFSSGGLNLLPNKSVEERFNLISENIDDSFGKKLLRSTKGKFKPLESLGCFF